MEEVIGSIPIRSTNQTNNLAGSQKKRDTLSIRWFSCCTLRGFPRPIQKNVGPPDFEPPAWLASKRRVYLHFQMVLSTAA